MEEKNENKDVAFTSVKIKVESELNEIYMKSTMTQKFPNYLSSPLELKLIFQIIIKI